MPIIAGVPYNLATDDLLHHLKDEVIFILFKTIIVFLDCNDIVNKEREVYPINHLK